MGQVGAHGNYETLFLCRFDPVVPLDRERCQYREERPGWLLPSMLARLCRSVHRNSVAEKSNMILFGAKIRVPFVSPSGDPPAR